MSGNRARKSETRALTLWLGSHAKERGLGVGAGGTKEQLRFAKKRENGEPKREGTRRRNDLVEVGITWDVVSEERLQRRCWNRALSHGWERQ